MTDYITALNGFKQSAGLSSTLYCVYVDDLLLILSKAGIGCFISLYFVQGALAYADDLVLLAPTASAMRKRELKRKENSLCVKIMPANIVSPSMQLNPNV